jgi:hypothetical protein
MNSDPSCCGYSRGCALDTVSSTTSARHRTSLPRSASRPIIATRKDGTVPFAHAEALATVIRDSELIVSDADSHFIWFSRDYPTIAEKIRAFLEAARPGVEAPLAKGRGSV